MNVLTVALLQLESSGGDQAKNLQKGTEFCREAKTSGADIALFPEMWNCGYGATVPDLFADDIDFSDPVIQDKLTRWQAQAIATDSNYVKHFQDLARELDIAIALTYLQIWPTAPRNVMSLIDRHGEILYTYAKVHTCDFSLECGCIPGEEFFVTELDTGVGLVKVGAMICYDREFPESARILMLQGAEIILVPNASDMGTNRLNQLQSRAFENMVGIAMTNYAGAGHSAAYDGIAFADGQSRSMLLVEAGEAEGIYLAQFDLQMLRDYRQNETWGNAFRKPKTYQALVNVDVNIPFKRKSARR